MRAYNQLYVEDAQLCLAEMIDYAVCGLEVEADAFFRMFIACGLARQFEIGNPKYVAGMTGYDLANEVLLRTGSSIAVVEPRQTLDKSSWYWAGWALAYYQWHSCQSFGRLCELGLTPSRVEQSYILHEADIDVFVQRADEFVACALDGAPTNLQRARKRRKMTQGELARLSGVSLRMIQLYEQRQNNIDSAAAMTVARLARVLGCQMEDLLESPVGGAVEYAFVKL